MAPNAISTATTNLAAHAECFPRSPSLSYGPIRRADSAVDLEDRLSQAEGVDEDRACDRITSKGQFSPSRLQNCVNPLDEQTIAAQSFGKFVHGHGTE